MIKINDRGKFGIHNEEVTGTAIILSSVGISIMEDDSDDTYFVPWENLNYFFKEGHDGGQFLPQARDTYDA